MIHFTSICKNKRQLNLIAVGSLAFKMYSRFLLTQEVRACALHSLHLSSFVYLPKQDARLNHLYVVLVSDVTSEHLGPLSQYLMQARINFGYTVGVVLALDDSRAYKRAIQKLRPSFDVFIELNKFLVVEGEDLTHQEKQAYLCSDFTLQFLQVLRQLCHTEFQAEVQPNSTAPSPSFFTNHPRPSS